MAACHSGCILIPGLSQNENLLIRNEKLYVYKTKGPRLGIMVTSLYIPSPALEVKIRSFDEHEKGQRESCQLYITSNVIEIEQFSR